MNDSKPRPEPNYQQEQEAREIVRLVQEGEMDTVLFVGSILAERDAALSRLAAEKDAEYQEVVAAARKICASCGPTMDDTKRTYRAWNYWVRCEMLGPALASLPAPAEKGEREKGGGEHHCNDRDCPGSPCRMPHAGNSNCPYCPGGEHWKQALSGREG